MAVLIRHWFLFGLLALIPGGIVLAVSNPPEPLIRFLDSVPTPACTAAILFLMAVTLDTGRLVNSVRRPWPVLTAFGINQLVIPALCLPLLFLQKSQDLKVGLLIAASVPCTMAAASVWTRRALGNDAVSLLVTLLSNGLCFVVTPAWLTLGTRWFGTQELSGDLNFATLMLKLTLAALLPALAGQLLRLFRRPRGFIDRRKSLISVAAQSIILFLVFMSAFRGGLRFTDGGISGNLRHTEFAVAWISCIGLHLAAMAIAWGLTGWLKFELGDRTACTIAGSQKTLPIGILVSQATGLPFSLLPMLMYHASQLFIDTWIADRIRVQSEQMSSVSKQA
ncbi:MAG: bile acid:sodium symporter [Planctomycetaceae bacterium]